MKKANDRTGKSVAKRVATAVAACAIAAVAVVAILNYALGAIIEKSAPAVGPAVLGTPLAVSNANMRILAGRVQLGGVVVGPPEGFDANVFEMADFKVDLDVKSLLGSADEPIVIREIVIDGPFVSYELKGLHDNLHAILAKLGVEEGDEKEKPEDDGGKKAKDGRKVRIDRFLFDNAKVRVAVAGGKGVVVPLPKIELKGIGAKSGGATALEATGEILLSITTGTVKAAAGAGLDVGGAAVDAAAAVGSAVGDAAKGVIGAILGSSDEKTEETAAEADAAN